MIQYELSGPVDINGLLSVFFSGAEALRAMEKVASHINEMQKIYEDYGTVFDQLVAEQSGPEKEVHTILELLLKAYKDRIISSIFSLYDFNIKPVCCASGY